MRRFAVTFSLLIALMANCAWIIGCQSGSAQNPVASETDDSNVPDCCRNGICPYHREHPPQPSPSHSDCICHLSADSILMVSTAQIPAVHSYAALGVTTFSPTESGLASFSPRSISLALPVLTPPPRS